MKTIVTNEKRRLGGKITCMIAMIAIILATGFFLRKPANAEMTYPTSSTSAASADSIWFIATEIAMNATESSINIEVETAPAVIASTPAVVVSNPAVVASMSAVEPKVHKAMKKLNATKSKNSKKSPKKKKGNISLEEYKKGMRINMDVSKPSGLSKKVFINLLKQLKAKILKLGPDIPPDPKGLYKKDAAFIWELGQKYQVDEVFLTAITGHEGAWLGFDLAIERNNFTGQMNNLSKLRSYSSFHANLEATAKNLRKNYLGTRKTLYQINTLYCEPNEKGEYTWYKGVYGCMKTIVGD